jgi:hypothetical protein
VSLWLKDIDVEGKRKRESVVPEAKIDAIKDKLPSSCSPTKSVRKLAAL